jgi:hypothetical protein
VALVASLLTVASLRAMGEEWPVDMAPTELSARTNVHDGYVLRALPASVAPVDQSGPVTASRSTFDYIAGYSPVLQKWIELPDGRLPKGVTQVGVRATLRAVQVGGENWQAVLTSPTGRVKRLFVTAYQSVGPGGMQDCFADYLTQRPVCHGRAAQVLWFVEARCLQSGVSTFALQDEPSGRAMDVARLTVTVPGKVRTDRADPCAVKPTPVTEHDQNPEERAFQMLAQRELMMSRGVSIAADASLTVQLVSQGHLVLTDDRGRQTGFDIATRTARAQIPQSTYRSNPVPPAWTSDPQARPIRSIVVAHPESTEYVLRVQGTEGDPYALSVGAMQDGRGITLIQTDPHVASDIRYRVRVNSDDARQIHVVGDFNGTARSGTGLLTFATPTSVRTALPAGTMRTDVLIFYDAGIDPESFRAQLNGKNASAMFHPYKGWREVVGVPLTSGVNRLDLVIKGRIAAKRRTDRVSLAFVVGQSGQ